MKEADKDFYRGVMAVTYHRIFRFWPSGDVFVYLTSQHPSAVRRAAVAVSPSRKASLNKLKAACWGRFELSEADEATTLRLRVSLYDPAYPNAVPVSVLYEMALAGATRPAATNCDLVLSRHSLVGDLDGDEQTFEVPQPVCSFVSLAPPRREDPEEGGAAGGAAGSSSQA